MIKSDLAPYAKHKLHCIYFQETTDCLKVVRGDCYTELDRVGLWNTYKLSFTPFYKMWRPLR